MFNKNKKQAPIRSRRSEQRPVDSFRRNTTVFSRTQRELEQRQQSVTQRQYERKNVEARRRIQRRIGAVIAVVLLLFLAQRLQISRVSVASNASSKLSANEKTGYEATIQEEYNKHTFMGQFWLLDAKAFEEAMIQRYPEIRAVDVRAAVPFSTDLKTTISFRKAVFVWRDASGSTQFVDSSGVLFAKDLDATVNTKKLVAIEDQSGTVLEPGSPVLTTGLVQFIGQLHTKIPAVFQGKSIAKVIIPRSTREVQLQITDVPYLIKLSSQRTLEEQVGELVLLVNHLQAQKIQPSAYLDVRVPHKAFYK